MFYNHNLINTWSPNECPNGVSFSFFPWESNVVLALSFQKWTNLLLTWEPKHYGGIKRVRIDPKLLWIPDVVLYNRSVRQFNDQILSWSNVFIWLVSLLRTWLKGLKTIRCARCSIIDLPTFLISDWKSHLLKGVAAIVWKTTHKAIFFNST